MAKEKLILTDEDRRLASAISDLTKEEQCKIEEILTDPEHRDIYLFGIKNTAQQKFDTAKEVLDILEEKEQREIDEKNETDNDALLEEKLKKHIPSMLDGIRKIAEVHDVTAQEVLQTLEKMLDIRAGIPRINDVLTVKLSDEMSDDLDNLEKLANDVGLTTEILLKRIKEENNK